MILRPKMHRGSVELHEALSQIRMLEEEKDKLAKEVSHDLLVHFTA